MNLYSSVILSVKIYNMSLYFLVFFFHSFFSLFNSLDIYRKIISSVFTDGYCESIINRKNPSQSTNGNTLSVCLFVFAIFLVVIMVIFNIYLCLTLISLIGYQLWYQLYWGKLCISFILIKSPNPHQKRWGGN
jgi:hypothetical protein